MKSKYNRLLAILLLVTAAGLGAASADTTTITYSYYTATSSADTSWVSPAGYTSVKAVNFGSGETSFGGVTWLTSNPNSGPFGPGSYNNAAPIPMFFSAPGKGWAENANTFYSGGPALLSDGAWSTDQNDGVDYTIDLQGFTVGQEYLVQFVLADTREEFVGRTITLDGYSANIAGQDASAYQFAYSDGKFAVVTARFTPGAGDTDFSFRALNSGGGLQVNGIQVLTSADPFLAWINTFFPGETDPLIIGATADPDNDGIENLVEYVLKNGDPDASSTGILPTLDATGANFVFTYLRRTDGTGTTQTFQYGSDLIGWTNVTVTDGGIVSITSPEAGIQQVVITVAKGTNTKLFGRLQVVK